MNSEGSLDQFVEVQDRPLISYADEEKQEQKWQLNANCGRITSYAANQLHKIRRHSKLKQPHSIQPHQLILTQHYLPFEETWKTALELDEKLCSGLTLSNQDWMVVVSNEIPEV